MKFQVMLMIPLFFGILYSGAVAHAEERHEGERDRPEGRAENERRALPPNKRAAPFPGNGFRPPQHPHVPAPRPALHPMHVYNPYIIHRGAYSWHPWRPLEFVRPVYYFDWDRLNTLTCMAEDSYGDQYPVTEGGYHGPQFQSQLDSVEDASLSRCFAESGGDPQCHLVSCLPGY